MHQILCTNCGKKIAEAKMTDGVVSIKCNKCGTINKIESNKTSESQRVPAGNNG